VIFVAGALAVWLVRAMVSTASSGRLNCDCIVIGLRMDVH
jgi:hypothetical protein